VLGGLLDYIYINSLSSQLPIGIMFAVRSIGLVVFVYMAWSNRAAHHWVGMAVLVMLQVGWVLAVSNNPNVF